MPPAKSITSTNVVIACPPVPSPAGAACVQPASSDDHQSAAGRTVACIRHHHQAAKQSSAARRTIAPVAEVCFASHALPPRRRALNLVAATPGQRAIMRHSLFASRLVHTSGRPHITARRPTRHPAHTRQRYASHRHQQCRQHRSLTVPSRPEIPGTIKNIRALPRRRLTPEYSALSASASSVFSSAPSRRPVLGLCSCPLCCGR